MSIDKEFIEQVRAWHKDTFPFVTTGVMISKLHEEGNEVEQALRGFNSKETAPEELADVLLVLIAIASRSDIDLIKAIHTKFELNKQRAKDGRWNP